MTIGAPSPRPTPPPWPLNLTTFNGLPRLSWSPPSSGTVAFYRIYRDGTRYDRTSDASTSFTDASAGSSAHFYWITAVDSTFNESDALGPVIWWG